MAKKTFFKKNLGFFSKTVFICNIIAVILLLLSYSAAFINPETIWPIAFFGLGYLPILLLNLGFVAYWFLRRPKYALFTLIPILLGWNLLTQHVGFRSKIEQEPKKDQDAMRVMTFNAHLFKDVKETPGSDIKKEVLEIIKETNPDVLCFQEFFTKIKGSKKLSDKINDQIGFRSFYFEPAMKSNSEGYGQIIYSKFPIVNSGIIAHNEYGINRIIFADIVKAEDTIRVYNVHLRSFALQNEDKEFIQNLSANSEQNEGASRRLGRKLKYAFAKRSQQATALKNHIDSTQHPIIVMGDFNDTPMSYSVNHIRKNLRNTFQEKGQGWGVTHYEMLPFFQIDYILCSKQFQVNNYKIIKKKLSDHYPVYADILLTSR
ncbi:endonuclease/exonuclease/phosphatase family protein [Sphingobacterium psychroaquaticum]|uniref:Metal-dependent hydrolase, endonuclease/exonuclease/phosphatase family n=1 Tax=Sphingobacterium psychroaquaticum TaxID=561061 RepID=A0A1X7KFZ6_9SPHI|nr:endonuclease/exonuclease/phosphatase family protein [Sphingobacterium psychroaquaticum]SMG40215.1 Metal-dependent hydrolase, endonuclease/exonuclease/phosphatase family [Sphingobacterium psychroaquaticum]